MTRRSLYLVLVSILMLGMAACATAPEDSAAREAFYAANDPFEPTNRYIFDVNTAVDDLVIVDTESGYPRLGLAATLADAVGARLVALSDLEGSDPGRELAGGLGGFGR